MVHLEEARGVWIVDVLLNGAHPARFLVDTGSSVTLASLRVGTAELRDVPVVLHDPGPGIDGILGNTVLARYRLTLDSDRHLLQLTAR